LVRDQRRWRDLTVAEARKRVGDIATRLAGNYREGLLQESDQSRFLARVMSDSLQDLVEVLVGWMHSQYRFDPVFVELPFGDQPEAPAWKIQIDPTHTLEIQGRIDRVDLCPIPGTDKAFCVVIDYKSSQKNLDPVLLAYGLQLQLPTYLNVLRHWPEPAKRFKAGDLVPAGMFYLNLRGKTKPAANRAEGLNGADAGRLLAYRHAGRFDVSALKSLDARNAVATGDQFNYRLTQKGELNGGCREALKPAAFQTLLQRAEDNLKQMAQEIFAGRIEVAPYRKGGAIACDECSYHAICRIDPWTHRFRILKQPQEQAGRTDSQDDAD